MGFSREINPELVAKDIQELINKYYQGMPMNMTLDGPEASKGFFLLFIQKDNSNKEGNLSVKTFGNNVTIGQLIDAFEDVLKNIQEKAINRKIPVA